MDFSAIDAKRAKAAERKARRAEKAKALGHKKRGKKISARKRAFLRLKQACKTLVARRCILRTGGYCEIGIACGGKELATVWYHGWPQKGGNGLRYDTRSHFASCSFCNFGEFGARYRGSPVYKDRHKQLLGPDLYAELDSLHGRRQISTAEANEMADKLERQISAGNYA